MCQILALTVLYVPRSGVGISHRVLGVRVRARSQHRLDLQETAVLRCLVQRRPRHLQSKQPLKRTGKIWMYHSTPSSSNLHCQKGVDLTLFSYKI